MVTLPCQVSSSLFRSDAFESIGEKSHAIATSLLSAAIALTNDGPDKTQQLGDHWLLSKMGFFDQSYNLPLIIRDPRPAADRASCQPLDLLLCLRHIRPSVCRLSLSPQRRWLH